MFIFLLLTNFLFTFALHSKHTPHFFWPFPLFDIPPHFKEFFPSLPLCLILRIYIHPNKRDGLWGLAKVWNMLHCKKELDWIGKCILNHVAVWLLSFKWKMISLKSVHLNSLHFSIEFTSLLAVNLTIS